ncbi:MAG: hypothetical protein FJZ92_02875 [Chloroflexi bacterium]|nr:hypothetical protein [Chloroflexota bacterium]
MPAPTTPAEVEATVRALFAAAGVPVTAAELEKFVQAYPTLRANADGLYIDEVRYEEPALGFAPLAPTPRRRRVTGGAR